MELNMNARGGVAQVDLAPKPGAVERHERVLPEQKVYADLLDIGMKAGLAMLVISFTLYVLGVVDPHVPLSDIPSYWSMPVAQYLQIANVGTGWSWVGNVHKGDFLNFVGIAFLSGVTIVCYLRVLPITWRAGEKLFSGILAATALVLLLGASGILVVGH